MHGEFFWYDVMTSDTGAARQFYTEVLGWGTQKADSAGQEYTVFTVDGTGVAGLMPIPETVRSAGGQPAWLGYVAVDDVDQAATQIEQAGGTIHRPPTEVPGIIRFAVVADPQGAVFLVARGLSDQPMPTLPLGTPGTIGWRELYAEDAQTALVFYQKMFGWTEVSALDMGPAGTYRTFSFSSDGVHAGGMMNKPALAPRPYWGFYFAVPAIDAAAARVTAAGGQIMHGPMEVPGGQWIINCMDPQGAVFSLVAARR